MPRPSLVTTPRKQLTRSNLAKVPSTPRSQKVRLDGLIKGGVWYCTPLPHPSALFIPNWLPATRQMLT